MWVKEPWEASATKLPRRPRRLNPEERSDGAQTDLLCEIKIWKWLDNRPASMRVEERIIKSYDPLGQEEKIIETKNTKKYQENNRTEHTFYKIRRGNIIIVLQDNYLQFNSKLKTNKNYDNNG
jgi:hypothetical protein